MACSLCAGRDEVCPECSPPPPPPTAPPLPPPTAPPLPPPTAPPLPPPPAIDVDDCLKILDACHQDFNGDEELRKVGKALALTVLAELRRQVERRS